MFQILLYSAALRRLSGSMKLVCGLAAVAIWASAAAPASADTIATFTLDNVTFDNSATASGGFDYDVNTGAVSNVNIPTTLDFDPTRRPPNFKLTWSAAFAGSISASLSASSSPHPSQFLFAMQDIQFTEVFALSFVLADASGNALDQPLSTSNVVNGASFPLFVLTDFASHASDAFPRSDFAFESSVISGALDVTAISTVPEPSTWAMMLPGFGGIGFIAYRRKSKPSLIAA